jgi:hypothetical protein
MKKHRYTAQSLDLQYWYPVVWSDYLGSYIQIGNGRTFANPEAAIRWSLDNFSINGANPEVEHRP